MHLLSALWNGRWEQLDLGWHELSDIVDKAEGLGSYALEPLFEVVSEVGKGVDSPAFDALYEKLVAVIRKRRSDGAAAEAYTQRAFQKLDHEKPYDAIRWFGRAEELFIKEEYCTELVLALLGSSDAYNQVGLAWAARNKALAAVERALAVFHEQGRIIPLALVVLQRLVWAELQLGRIPHVINAMKLASGVAAALNLEGKRAEAFSDQRTDQEAVLGIHLLNIPADALPTVSQLHDGLEQAGFFTAAMALLYSLGQAQALRDEGYLQPTKDDESVTSLFEAWLKQPAAEQIPDKPMLIEGEVSIFKSIILGCEISVEVPNTPVSVSLAESVLGSLEAFLATSDETDLLPHREELRVIIAAEPQHIGAPKVRFPDDTGYPRVEIIHAADYAFRTAADFHCYRESLKEIIIQILCRVAKIHDVEAWLEKVAGEERAFSRAVALGDTLTLNGNIFGNNPPIRIQDHIPANARHFAPLRIMPLKPSVPMHEATAPPKLGKGVPPDNLRDPERLKHTDRRVLSPIDINLWDEAGWRGTAFGYSPDRHPPVLALAFTNLNAGKAIFREWLDRWGNQGSDEALRIAIVTGVMIQNPAAYSVVVGPNLSNAISNRAKTLFMVSRINRMHAATPKNLEMFLAAYHRVGAYLLAHVSLWRR